MKTLFLITLIASGASFAQSLPLKDLGLIPTIKVYPSPEVKEQKKAIPAVAASAASAVKPVK